MVPRAVTALVGLALLGGQACAHGEALADPRAPVLALIDGDLAAMVADPQSAAGLTTLAVRTTSMGPTVGAGDLVVVDRSAYAAAPPARGDVVAFRMTPSAAVVCGIGRGGISVKRVVGVPGDDVRVGPAGVMVGGTAAVVAGSRPPDLTRDFGRVPDGSVLLIGDDAPESCDAVRWPQPFIPHANLIGRVEGIVAPRDHAGLLRTGGGVDRRMPAGVQRARLDALVDLGRGARAFAVGLTTPHVCSIIVAGDCRTRLARTLADIVRQERGRLRIRLRELAGDCSIAPLRALRRDLGRDHRALVAPGRPLRHVVRAVGVHRSRAAVGVAGCWGATAGPVVGLLR